MTAQSSKGSVQLAVFGTSSLSARQANHSPYYPLALAANIAGVLGALALIWAQEVSLYWVGPTQVSNESLSRAMSAPAQEILAEIGEQRLVALIDPIDAQD